MNKSKRARIVKALITFGATGIMRDACAGEATSCIYSGVRHGEPVTFGKSSQAIMTQLPVMAQSVITFGGL